MRATLVDLCKHHVYYETKRSLMREPVSMSSTMKSQEQQLNRSRDERCETTPNVDRREFLSLAAGGALALSATHFESAKAAEKSSSAQSVSASALTDAFANPPMNAG